MTANRLAIYRRAISGRRTDRDIVEVLYHTHDCSPEEIAIVTGWPIEKAMDVHCVVAMAEVRAVARASKWA